MKLGSNLLVVVKKPEEVIQDLLLEDKNSQNIVVFQSEICYEEIEVQKAIASKLKGAKAVKGINAYTKAVWGQTLHHIDDFEYDPRKTLPTPFTKFFNGNAKVAVRDLLPDPMDSEVPFP